ncbi:MAG: inositol-3-phosphate synthase, partial [Chitinophagaceae bacterium]|nr:inositol-3-phosphate synthase [Chitinophagaceae bacterium]
MDYQIKSADGKLGILIPGLGAVATTFIAGVESIKKGQSQPVGSVSQMGNIRLGKRTENRYPLIKDFVPLAKLDNIAFGGWDVYADNVYESAVNAKVLEPGILQSIKSELEAIKPMKAVFDREYVKNLDGTHVKEAATKWDLALALMQDIENFKKENNCDR